MGTIRTSTLIAGVRLGGACAPWLFDGAMDGRCWRVRQGLVPVLQTGDLVIMDNLATHKVAGVREAIEAAAARLLIFAALSAGFQPHRRMMWMQDQAFQALRSLSPRTQTERLQGCAWLGF